MTSLATSPKAAWAAPIWVARSLRSPRARVGALSVATFLLFWEMAGRLEWINPLFISYPTDVLSSGAELFGAGLTEHLTASLVPFAIGFLSSIAVGVPLGLALGRIKLLRLLSQWIVMALYSMPRLAILPILLIWLGIGVLSTSIVVFLGGLFPILVTSMAGVLEVNRSWIAAAKAFGANEFAIFCRVILPATVPYIFSGIRLGLGRALLGVVVSEMYVSQAGVGRVIMRAAQAFQTGQLMFVVFLVAAFGASLVVVLGAIESRLVVWRRSPTGRR